MNASMRIIKSVMATAVLMGSWFYGQAQSNTFPSSGNVGIGTLSPSSPLEVNGSIKVSTDTDAVLTFNNFDDSWQYLQFKQSNVRKTWMGLYTNGDFRITKENGGSISLMGSNIGIGTNSPNKKLHVRQSQGSTQLRLERTTTNSGFTDLGSDKNGLWFWVGGYDGFNNAEVVFANDGNVGIGTVDPTTKLSVNGTTKTKEVIVTDQAGDWPDYVFADPEYQLPSLGELETYINVYKHLPGIPTKNEIEKEGQYLGVIQAKLLEKIEELTLHTIGQQKLIVKQQKENKQLRRRIELIEKQLSQN